MIDKVWREIDAWFETHEATKNLANQRKGATKAQLAALEKRIGKKLPADFRKSLAIHNGGGDFASYELYGVKEIGDTWARRTRRHDAGDVPKRAWNRAWIPFAEDSCGNLRALDPVKSRLLAIEVQGPAGVFATPRRTFTNWLSAYAEQLSTGKYVVDEDGFVGEPRTPREVHPDEVGKDLESKLSISVIRDEVAKIRKLLDAGTIHANSRTSFMTPILTHAARHGCKKTIELLLERGADVNIAVGEGDRNPLMAACYSSTPNLETIEMLLAAGADPRTKNSREKDTIDVAKEYSQPALVALLERYAKKKKR